MIIWINGTYGAGKTTIAELLHKELTPSYIYDPENIGDFFRHNLPKSIQEPDFTYYPEWRKWNVHVLEKIYHEYDGDIIAPMTLYHPPYFDEVINELRRKGLEIYHFQLDVSKERIIERLKERPEYLYQWGINKVDEALKGFEKIPQKEKIQNERVTPEEVVAQILQKIGRAKQ